jgi:hypothetical protein
MRTSSRDSMESSHPDIHDSENDDMSPITPVPDPEKAIPPVPNSLAAADWTGPDDPENPQNWPQWIRHYHAVPPALISFAA